MTVISLFCKIKQDEDGHKGKEKTPMSMKIGRGIIKGRQIKYTHGKGRLRPTSSKAREALFDILGQRIQGARFLDLYAGTGAVGLEAFSRGASEAVFVEISRKYTAGIKQTLTKCVFPSGNVQVLNKKTLSFIEQAEAAGSAFDIIFMDPPYHTEEIIHALSAIGMSHILRQDGVVVAEHFTKRQLPERFDRLQKVKDYRYGDTMLSLYKASKDA